MKSKEKSRLVTLEGMTYKMGNNNGKGCFACDLYYCCHTKGYHIRKDSRMFNICHCFGKGICFKKDEKDEADKKADRKADMQKGKDCRFRRSQIQGDKDRKGGMLDLPPEKTMHDRMRKREA